MSRVPAGRGVPWKELLAAALCGNEAPRAILFGVRRWPDWLCRIPFVRALAGFWQRYCVAVLTTERIIVIDLLQPAHLQRAERYVMYPLSEIADVSFEPRPLSGAVSVRIRHGPAYVFRDVDRESGERFVGQFNGCRQHARPQGE